MDWNALAHPWIEHEDAIERAHAPVKTGLLATAGLRAGERVLDIGCGSGATSLDAARSVGKDGAVISVDIAPAFVDRLRARATALPQVTALQGDAQSHDFDGLDCDVVISLFGTMFFDDAGAAFGNIAKALKPGGRIAFVVWDGPRHNPWFSVPGQALAGALPDLPPPDPEAPGPMAFADVEKVTGLLRSAGLDAIGAEHIDTHLTPVGAAADVTAMMLAVGPFRGAVAQFAAEDAQDAALARIATAMSDGYAQFASDDGVHVPARVIYYTATRPPV